MLESLEPRAVFSVFEALCQLPHGSGNTGAVRDYCRTFAAAHGIACREDASGTIWMKKGASAGYAGHAPVCLQGHLDMVCETDGTVAVDFAHAPLQVRTDGEWVFAEHTTLGGDDGIAVAYVLALLADDHLPHPPLEVLLTVDEEIGMLGAAAADLSGLSARTLINIDSEEEGVLTVGCAGGTMVTLDIPVRRQPVRGTVCTVSVSGLSGGHSGTEIHKGHANANRVLAEALRVVADQMPVRLMLLQGGLKDNAIPRAATATLAVEDFCKAQQLVMRAALRLRAAFPAESGLSVMLMPSEEDGEGLTVTDSRRVIRLLCEVPNGVQSMSADIPGLVQTSLNLGILLLHDASASLTFSVRSMTAREKTHLTDRLKAMAVRYGGTATCQGNYPAWEYRTVSPLREVMEAVYREQYGRDAVVAAVHAGLECGLFSAGIPGLDAVSIGPEMRGIHTADERLSVASVGRVWRFLCEVLRRL